MPTETARQPIELHPSNSLPTKLLQPIPARERLKISDVRSVLADDRFDRTTRLLRLQGWRGEGLTAACRAGNAGRLAPAVCALLGIAVAATASLPLAIITLASALIGIVAPNHPVEMLYNRVAPRVGRSPLPANRAAKRLGCVMGAAFFAGSTVALLIGEPTSGRGIAATMGVVAAFVAVSNICLPSIVFTLLWGKDRATARRLVGG